MLKEGRDQSLVLFDFLFVLSFLHLELLCKLVNLLFLLIKNFVLLLLATLSVLLSKVLVDFFDILLISIYHLFHLNDLLINLLDLCVILFDTVLESFSGLWKRKVHLVGLELQVLLLLGKHCSLLL